MSIPALNTNITSNLEQLASTASFIDQEQAKQVIQLVNYRLSRILAPHIVDVMWRSDEDDRVVFRPLESKLFDDTPRNGAGWFYLPKDSSSQTGVWAFACETKDVVWVENIKDVDHYMEGLFRFLKKPIVNQATGEQIPTRYLSFFRGTDSMLAVPLLVEGSVRGIYSIELPASRNFSKWTIETIKVLADSIARILSQVDEFRAGQKQTSEAVESFQALIYQSEVPTTDIRMKVFLCHSSKDKPAVRDLYSRLYADGFNPWLDVKNLMAGQDWAFEIEKAINSSDVVIVCLSRNATNAAGYIHKEIGRALDIAERQPEGTIFVIPLRLEECDVPERLRRWHWVDLYDEAGYDLLLKALQTRATSIN